MAQFELVSGASMHSSLARLDNSVVISQEEIGDDVHFDMISFTETALEDLHNKMDAEVDKLFEITEDIVSEMKYSTSESFYAYAKNAEKIAKQAGEGIVGMLEYAQEHADRKLEDLQQAADYGFWELKSELNLDFDKLAMELEKKYKDTLKESLGETTDDMTQTGTGFVEKPKDEELINNIVLEFLTDSGAVLSSEYRLHPDLEPVLEEGWKLCADRACQTGISPLKPFPLQPLAYKIFIMRKCPYITTDKLGVLHQKQDKNKIPKWYISSGIQTGVDVFPLRNEAIMCDSEMNPKLGINRCATPTKSKLDLNPHPIDPQLKAILDDQKKTNAKLLKDILAEGDQPDEVYLNMDSIRYSDAKPTEGPIHYSKGVQNLSNSGLATLKTKK